MLRHFLHFTFQHFIRYYLKVWLWLFLYTVFLIREKNSININPFTCSQNINATGLNLSVFANLLFCTSAFCHISDLEDTVYDFVNLYWKLVVHAILIHTIQHLALIDIILFIFMGNEHWLDKDMLISISDSSTVESDWRRFPLGHDFSGKVVA